MRIEKYALRLDNSICDLVTLRTPNNIYKCDQKTPIEKAHLEKIYPNRTGVLLAHINPTDQTGRKCYVYFDYDKPNDMPSEIDMCMVNFEMNPKLFHEHLQKGIRNKIFTVELENLVYIQPYKFKREKIVTDNNTYALMKDLENSPFSRLTKDKLKDYNWATRDQTSIPDLTTCGKVKADYNPNALYCFEVTFPNNTNIRVRGEDLMFFHELED